MAATPIVLLATAGNQEEAERLARTLVERRLAACVNLVPGVSSVYRWRGEVCRDDEVLLLVKTTAERLAELRTVWRQLHSYELPELVQLDVSGGDGEYLSWLVGEVTESEAGHSRD